MPRRIRVLNLITQLVVGGAQESLFSALAFMDRQRYEIHIASAPGGTWEQRARSLCDKLHIIPHLRYVPFSPINDLLATAELIALLRRERYDILHTRSSKAGFLGRLAARLIHVPVVVHHIHGLAFNDRTHSSVVRWLFIIAERWAAKHCNKLIAVSRAMRTQALQAGIGSPEQLVVIYDPVDVRRFNHLPDKRVAKETLGIPPKAPAIGTVGRLSACNAPDVLVAIAEELAMRRPDCCFVIAGDGEMRTKLEKAASKTNSFRLLGFQNDIPLVLSAMTIYVGTSLWGGLPRSVIEAMCAGLPVVAFPAAGVPEVLVDGVTGLQADMGSSKDVVEKVLFLLDHPEQAKALGEAARANVLPLVDPEKHARELDALYERLMHNKTKIVQ